MGAAGLSPALKMMTKISLGKHLHCTQQARKNEITEGNGTGYIKTAISSITFPFGRRIDR